MQPARFSSSAKKEPEQPVCCFLTPSFPGGKKIKNPLERKVTRIRDGDCGSSEPAQCNFNLSHSVALSFHSTNWCRFHVREPLPLSAPSPIPGQSKPPLFNKLIFLFSFIRSKREIKKSSPNKFLQEIFHSLCVAFKLRLFIPFIIFPGKATNLRRRKKKKEDHLPYGSSVFQNQCLGMRVRVRDSWQTSQQPETGVWEDWADPRQMALGCLPGIKNK